ncbi:aldo/keto reductase [Nocardia sp. NPDC004415]
MRYRTLGRTGIKVSPYALGAMMFGAAGNPDHTESIRIIHAALDAGINVIDTADIYSGGESEVIVGKALARRRDAVVLATKSHLPMGEDPSRRSNSRRWIVTAVEESLRRLDTDHIDVFQMHRPDPDTDIEETLSVLTDLVRSGKIRAFGSSTTPVSEIVEAQWAAERRGYERFRTEQPPYSILNRGIEREVLPAVRRYGMGALVWSRLVHPAVSAAIIGPRTMAHLEDALAGARVTLDDEILDRIDAIVAPGTDIGRLDMDYDTPAVLDPALRRRPAADRAAA